MARGQAAARAYNKGVDGEWRGDLTVVARQGRETLAERRHLRIHGKGLCFILLLGLLLPSCGLGDLVNLHSGIEKVAGRGDPPAQKLTWSRTNMNKLLVTASESGFGKSQVFVLDLSTGQKDMIAESDYGIIAGEAWSPDEAKVVLEIDPGTVGYEKNPGLWIWDAKTDSPLQFLGNGGQAIWSPSGKSIAVFETNHGLQTISLWDVQSKGKQSIVLRDSNSIGDVVAADWSPDERKIVLALGNPRSSIDQYLYIYDISDGSLTRLTNQGDVYQVAWSPLGAQVAYVLHIRGTGTDYLHLINVDGTCDREIPSANWIRSLSWSPDGSKLAFIGPAGIYTVDMDAFLTEYSANNSCH